MPGITDTQALRFGLVADPIDWTMLRNLADDIAAQLDLADLAAIAALQMPAVIAQRNTALALPVTTATAVPWNNEIQDTHGMLDTAGATPNRLTVSAAAGAGLYVTSIQVQTDTTGWTRGDVILNKGASGYARKTWDQPQSFGYMQMTAMVRLGVVGDFIGWQIYHEGGGTTNTTEVNVRVYKIANE